MLDIEITDENIDSITEQMVEENQVYELDCMALNPAIKAKVDQGLRRGGYELTIHKIIVDDQEVFIMYCEDGYDGDSEDFAARAEFYKTEADAKAGLGAEYNAWLARFAD